MLQFLTDIPIYNTTTFSGLSEGEYQNLVQVFREKINRATELFEAYWRTSDVTLFNMSLDTLMDAHLQMETITSYITNAAVIHKLNCRATFTYDLAATMMGAKIWQKT